MTTNKQVFTLRLDEGTYQKIGHLATAEHRSMSNYIEYVLLRHIAEIEKERGEIMVDASLASLCPKG